VVFYLSFLSHTEENKFIFVINNVKGNGKVPSILLYLLFCPFLCLRLLIWGICNRLKRLNNFFRKRVAETLSSQFASERGNRQSQQAEATDREATGRGSRQRQQATGRGNRERQQAEATGRGNRQRVERGDLLRNKE